MGRRARSSTDLNRQQRSCLNFSGIVSLKIRNSLVCIIQIEWNISMKFVISSDYFCLYFQTHFEESSILLNNSNFAEVSLSPFYPASVQKLPFLHFYSLPNIWSKPHIRSKIRIQIYDQHIYEPPHFLSYMVHGWPPNICHSKSIAGNKIFSTLFLQKWRFRDFQWTT